MANGTYYRYACRLINLLMRHLSCAVLLFAIPRRAWQHLFLCVAAADCAEVASGSPRHDWHELRDQHGSTARGGGGGAVPQLCAPGVTVYSSTYTVVDR